MGRRSALHCHNTTCTTPAAANRRWPKAWGGNALYKDGCGRAHCRPTFTNAAARTRRCESTSPGSAAGSPLSPGRCEGLCRSAPLQVRRRRRRPSPSRPRLLSSSRAPLRASRSAGSGARGAAGRSRVRPRGPPRTRPYARRGRGARRSGRSSPKCRLSRAATMARCRRTRRAAPGRAAPTAPTRRRPSSRPRSPPPRRRRRRGGTPPPTATRRGHRRRRRGTALPAASGTPPPRRGPR
mmetsp:Transcript_118998/g.333318  ORF Transcript_118998/g.333318 Transcript_118998/m.333318 type:complete len:239 (-) Transcript_118998:322-1038(-)